MTQLAEPNATAGHPLAHVGTLLADADALCRAVAGRDLTDCPLYVVPQSSLPTGYYSGDRHYAFTSPSLDIYLRDHICGYHGRGPCMVVNDLGLVEDFDPEDLPYVLPTTVVHELIHILDRPSLFEDRTGEDPDKLLFESLVIADATTRPPREDLPAYFGHGDTFIRIALHLCHRAEQVGVSIRPAALCGGHRYGLSHAGDYQDALGYEPVRYADMPFRAIAATNPPPEFRALWAHDSALYHRRFPQLKGVSR